MSRLIYRIGLVFIMGGLILLGCAEAGPLKPPSKLGEIGPRVSTNIWNRCQERVRKDLLYSPDAAKFELVETQMVSIETGEGMEQYYGPLIWRFKATAFPSNAFGTLVRKELRCYVAFDKESDTETVAHELLDIGQDPMIWEGE